MRRLTALFALTLTAVAGGAGSAPDAPLVLEQTIVLPNVAGRIDHLAVDVQHRRLFVAALGADTIEVVDLAAGRPVKRLAGLKEPQGLAYLPESDLLVSASGGDGVVRFHAGADLSPAGEIALGDDADNVRVDEASSQVVVGYGAGGLAVIDPSARKVVRTIALGAHPESFRIDPRTGRAFVNLPGARRIAVVDLKRGAVAARWPQGLALANFPMALDPSGGTIAVVFRAPAQLALIDTRTGAARQRLKTCGDSDDVFFDPPHGALYVSCGQGVVDVFHGSGGAYVHAGQVQTRPGARTSLFVPELDRLYVAARAAGGAPAAILVYRPAP